MGTFDSKSNQLRVRITSEERELLNQLLTSRQSGETISDLVREGISLLVHNGIAGKTATLPPAFQERIERLADLLKREPRQVEEACIEGILDLIDNKCDVPLIVMETKLHQKYRSRGGAEESAPPVTAGSVESSLPLI